jgi:uncharacterized protein (DUF58 family)
MTPLPVLLIAIVGFGAAFILGSTVPAWLSGALIAALIFGLLTSRKIKASAMVSREADRLLIPPGDSVTARVSISHVGKAFLQWMVVMDSLPPGATSNAPTGLVSFGGLKVDNSFFYSALFPVRGVFPLGPVKISHGDILALRFTTEPVDEPTWIRVHPKIYPVPPVMLPSSRLLGERRGDPRSSEDPTRPMGTRLYVPGDAQKRIHWRATARTGTLVSKVYDGSSEPIHAVIINTCRHDYTNPANFELACVAAASLCNALTLTDQDVGLLGQTWQEPGTGQLHLERCLSELAGVQLDNVLLSEKLLQTNRDIPWRSTIIVVTQKLDEDAAAWLDLRRKAGNSIAVMVVGASMESDEAVKRASMIRAHVAHARTEETIESAGFISPSRS